MIAVVAVPLVVWVERRLVWTSSERYLLGLRVGWNRPLPLWIMFTLAGLGLASQSSTRISPLSEAWVVRLK